MEKEMIKETKEQLLKVIEQIETADDFRKFLIKTMKVLLTVIRTLLTNISLISHQYQI